MEKQDTENYLFVILIKDLPMLLLQTSNTIAVGNTQTWYEVVSIATSMIAAWQGIAFYTTTVARCKGDCIHIMQWFVGYVLLYAVIISLGLQTNLNSDWSEWIRPEWLPDQFSRSLSNKAGYGIGILDG
jgi:hypothetical protein